MAFDLEGARAAGYSDDEIAGFLAEQKGFNLSAARDAGYSTGEIINFLDAGKPKQGLIDRALDVAKTAATSVIGGIKEDLGIGKKSSVMDDYQGPDPRQEQGPSDLAPMSKAGYQKARDFVRNAPADKVEQVSKGDGLAARAVKKAATDTSQDPGAIAEKVFRDAANEKEVAAAERQAKFKANPILDRIQQMAASLLQGDVAIADSVVGTIAAGQAAPQPIPVVVFQNLVRNLSPAVDEGFKKARAWRDDVSADVFEAYLKTSEAANNAIQATKSDRAKFGEKKQFFAEAAAWDQLAKDGVSNVPGNVANLIKSGELFGDKWKDGWAVTSDTMKSMPLSLLAMYPVFGSARTAYTTALAEATKNGLAREAAEEMAKKAAASTAARMGALSEGVTGAGSQYSGTYQKVMGMDDAQLQKDPNFQKILAQTPAGMPQAERMQLAKRMAAGGAAQTAAVIAGVADAAGAFLGDRYIGGAFAEGQQASGIIGKARAMAKGAATGMAEELPTEGFQSAGEQFGENLGVRQNANANQSLTADMGEQAAAGAASGAMMGGAMGGAAAIPNTAKTPQQLRSEAIGQEMQSAADAFQPAPASDATIRANMDPNGQNLVRVPEIKAPARPSLADMNQAQTVDQMAAVANAIANDNDLTSIINDAMQAAPTQPSAAAQINQQIQQAGAATDAVIPASLDLASPESANLKEQALQQLAQPAPGEAVPSPGNAQANGTPQDIIARQQFLPGHGQIQAIAPESITSQAGSIAPEQARALSILGSVLGKQVVFFSQTGATQRLDGFAPRDSQDTIFVNVAASPDAAWANVAGHEFFHQMPADIRLGFMQAVQNVIPDHQFQQLQKYINQPNLAPLGQWEEIAADLFGNRFSEPEFWGKVFQNVGDRTTAQKILAFVQQFINKITQAFQGQKQFDTDRFVPNLEAVREAAANAMQTYLQQGGGSELIGGKQVSEMSLQTLRSLAKQEGPAAQKALAELDLAGREAEQRQITIEQLFAQRAQQLEQSKAADYDKIQDAARTEKVEQAEAITKAQGFDEKQPTALELALRQAEERAGKPVQTRNADAIVAEVAKMKDSAKQTSERLRQDKPAKKEKVETPEQKAAREKREAQRQEKIDALKPLSIKELRKIAKDKRQALYLREAAAGLAAERQAEINAKLSDAGKKRKALTETVDPERDTMASAIVKLGGISRDSVQGRLRLTPEELAIKAPGANNLARHLFHQYGRTMESMGDALAELGYVERDENGKYDQRDFEDKLGEVAGGAEIYTDVGMIRQAEEQRAAEMEAIAVESPAEFAEFDQLAAELQRFTPEIEEAFHVEDSDIPFDLEDPRLKADNTLTDEDIDALFGTQSPQASGRSIEESSTGQARASAETGSDAIAKQGQEETDSERFTRLRNESEQEDAERVARGELPLGMYGSATQPLKFASGMSAPGDFTKMFAGNKNVGISIQHLSNKSIPEIAKAMAKSDGSYLFVDTGAFSVYKANERAKASGQLGFDDLLDDFPEGGKALDFDKILDKYHGLDVAIATTDDSGYSSSRVFFVMPDIVGNQVASLDLVSLYQDEINDREMNAIVPLQSGALSLTQAYEIMMENLGLDPDSDVSPIIGIPSAVEAASDDELTELLDTHGNRITAVHILGAVSDSELQPRLDAIKESGYDGNVSADANQLRSMLYGKTRRAEAMRRLTGDISVEEAKEPSDQFELLPQSRADLEEKDARANDQDIANKDLADSQREAFRLDAPAGTVEGEAKAMSNKRQDNLFSQERGDSENNLLADLPEGAKFVRGKGLIKGHYAVEIDGQVIGNYYPTPETAVANAKQSLAISEMYQKQSEQRIARESDIAEKLFAGEKPNDSDIKHLGLKNPAGFDYLSPVVQRLFGISRMKVREAMGDALRKAHTDMGAVKWIGDPKRALMNAAKWASDRDIQKPLFSGERNLIVQHNLSAAKLLHADRLGGLAVPSLAVTKKGSPLTGFGEITLIGSRDMVDPKGYAATKVFGADIYSPRYPSISYQFTPNMRKRFEAQFQEGMNATGNKYIDWSEVESNGARELTHQAGVMWTFLKNNNIEPQIIRTEPKTLPKRLQKYADDKRMGYELESDPEFIKDAYQEQEDILTKAYGGEEFRQDAQAEIEQWKENAKRRGVAHAIRSFANDVEQYRRDKQSAGKIDERATKYQLEQQLRDANLTDEFEDYAKEQFENIGPNERIFQGYTNTGNRKYIPHTLENVVKILKKELRGGENFSYGVGNVRAMYTPQFKTIKQIQEAKDRLVSKEQFEKVKAEIGEEFSAIENQLRHYHRASDRLGFGDSVAMMMQDSAKMGIPRALEENGFEEVDQDVMVEIRNFLEKLRHLPTEYFEAKILRDVSLAEFAGAVIPHNASDAVRKVLEKNGLETIEYQKGDEAARTKAIGELADQLDLAKDGKIKFSTGRTPTLDLNAPLAEQSPEVRRALRHEINRLRAEAWNAGKEFAGDPERADETITGQQLLDKIAERLNSLTDAAEYLQSLGVKFSNERIGTETPEFKNWFGRSMAVDVDGNPQVMYHASNRDFSVFDRKASMQWRKQSMDTVGSWFSDTPGEGGAAMYANGNGAAIYPVYLRIERPKVYDRFADFLRDMHAAEGRKLEDQPVRGIGSAEGLREQLKEQGYDGIAFVKTEVKQLMEDLEQAQDAIRRAKDEEYSVKSADRAPYTMKRERLERSADAIRSEIAYYGGSTEFDNQYVWVAFDPEQIKSAIGNNGQFDSSNPDIRFSGWRDRIIDRMDATFNGLSGLPEMNEYLKSRNLAMGKIGRVDEMVKKIRDAFADADTTGRQQIYQYLTTRGASATMISDQQLRTKAISIKQVINHVGQQLVARGLLDAQTQAQNADAYLPRLYLKHVLSEGDWKMLGGGKKPSDMGYLKKRKNIDPVVRELILGEIKDPTFLSASAIAKPLRDIALLDWLGQIAQNPAWIYPNQMIQYNGQMVTSYWLKAEADRIEKQAAHYQAAQKTAAIAIAQNMRNTANQAMANAANQDSEPENYKRVPDTQRYGILRGLLVNKSIYDDIIGQAGFMDPDPNWFRQVFFSGGLGTRLTQFWKFTKVAANPPGQIRNFISNLVMLNLSGVPMHVLPIRMVQALHDIVKHGPVYQAALTHGLTEGTFTTQELGHIKRDLLALEAQAQKLNPLVWMKVAGAWLYENLGKAYQFAETWTKIAKMLHEIKGGMSADDAAIEANKWLFDYSLVPSWVRDARSSPVGMPFITYQMKVLPRIAEVMLKAPWRLLPYIAMIQGMAYYAATSFGADDPDKKDYLIPKWMRDILRMKPLEMDAVMEAAPKWMKDKGNIVMLPTRDENGNLVLMDVSYFFPWSYWTAFAGQPFSDEPFKNTVSAITQNFSAPVIGTISALMLNKDGFTQREIYKQNDPDEVKRLAVLNYLYNNLVAPPVLTDGGLISPFGMADPAYGGRLMQAINGNTNRFGDQRSTMNQALLRGVGINEYPIDPEHTRASNIQQMQRQLQDAQTILRQKMKDQGLTEQQRERLRTEYVDHIQKQAEELQKYAERSDVPKAFAKR